MKRYVESSGCIQCWRTGGQFSDTSHARSFRWLAIAFLVLPMFTTVPGARAQVGEPALVEDLTPGPLGSSLSTFFSCQGDYTLFLAAPMYSGRSLWRTDGTSDGTFPLASPPGFLIPAACDDVGKGAFLVENEGVGYEDSLWWTDGTVAGTKRLVSGTELPEGLQLGTFWPGAMITGLTADSRPIRRFIFAAGPTNPSLSGTDDPELWVSDGTKTGTHPLQKDLNPGGSSSPREFLPFDRRVYFFLYVPGASGLSLWATDGTPEGTVVVSSEVDWRFMHVAGQWLYLFGEDPDGRRWLWRTSGLDSGLERVADFGPNSGIGFFGEFRDGRTLWRGGTVQNPGDYVWVSDGTAAGTRKLMKIRDITFLGDQAASSEAYQLGNSLYFIADDGSTGWELWETDGTVDGTKPAFETCPGTCTEIASPVIDKVAGRLVFHMRDAVKGIEGAFSDGTPQGTHVLDVCPGTCGAGAIVWLQAGGGILAFVSAATQGGTQLYVIDPDTLSSRQITAPPLFPGVSYFGEGFALLDKHLVFQGTTQATGEELWEVPIEAIPTVQVPSLGRVSFVMLMLLIGLAGSCLVGRP